MPDSLPPIARSVVLYLLLAIISADYARPQEPTAADDATIAELAAQMPKVPPRTPSDSLAAIEIHPDFRVTLVAAEPLVRDPVAIEFDDAGRLYVIELPPYNGYAVEGFEGHGSIRLLEDTNDDGVCDQSTVYLDDLRYPTALAWWDGGLFVGDAPDLLYVKDTDGDGRADSRQVVFTGFETDKAGEAHLNSIRWGLDNRFHLSTSLSGGDIRAVGNPDAPAVSARGRGLIFDPRDLTGFELTSGGGQHGMSMDDWGRKFVCSNSVPAQVLMYDDRYVARNSTLEAPTAAVDIAPEGKFTTLFRVSPTEPWRELRTSLRKTGKFRGSDEGGKPFGFFTGATGVTIYRGDAWPDEYHGNLLVGDVANNLVYRARLEARGVGLVARRADADHEFLASRDIWTRPVQFANAPDGNLYVLDIYRGLIEGAAFLPSEFLEFIDPVAGNDRGRIFRIEHKSFRRRPTPKLGQLRTEELVALLGHANGWHRDSASRLLYQRQDRASVAPLEALVQSCPRPEGRVAALYSLWGQRALSEALLLEELRDDSPLVRARALVIAEQFLTNSPAIETRMLDMVDDSDIRVRYQLAFSLGAAAGRGRYTALARLAKAEGADAWFRLAILSSLATGSGEVFNQLAQDAAYRATDHGRQFLVALAKQIGAAHRQDEIAAVTDVLSRLPANEKELSESLVTTLAQQLQGDQRRALLAAGGGRASEVLEQLTQRALAVAGDAAQPIVARVEAIRTLRLLPLEATRETLVGLLDLRQAVEAQAAAIDTLAAYDAPEVADALLSCWASLSPRLRTGAAEVLMSRPTWLAALLEGVENGEIARGDLDPARVELLKRHPDPKIAERVSRLFASSALPERQEVLDQYQSALRIAGDAERGKAVSKTVCSTCHRLEEVGDEVGADLKGIRNRGLPSILLNVLDPNREFKPQFQSYVIVTADGLVTTGMIQAESANSLTVRRADGVSVTIQRADIDELRGTGISFMPVGLEKQVSLEAMADLLAYLDSLP